jgi:hypothetical protein
MPSSSALAGFVTNGIAAGLVGASPSSVIARSKESTASKGKLQFPPSDIGNVKYGMQFKFIKREYANYGTKSKFTAEMTGAHVFLPMPTNVMETLNVNYNTSQLGAAGTLFEAGSNLIDGLLGSDGTTRNPSSAAVESAVKDVMNVSGYVARRLIGSISPESGQAIDLRYGNVVNPYTVAVFESTTPRNHTLTFKLIPRTKEDSETIRAIVDTFKYHSMPSRAGGSESTGGIFLKMPEELEVCFYGSEFLYKFARCVIQSVQVNYTPFGPPSFFAGSIGAPTGVELTLALQEIEQLTKESYGDDHLQLSSMG